MPPTPSPMGNMCVAPKCGIRRLHRPKRIGIITRSQFLLVPTTRGK